MFIYLQCGDCIREKHRGVVADHCVVCQKVTLFHVSDVVQHFQLYFVVLGSGTRLGSVKTCCNCGVKADCLVSGYSQMLTDEKANYLHVSDVLERTNPRLADSITWRARVEQEVQGLCTKKEQSRAATALALQMAKQFYASDPSCFLLMFAIGCFALIGMMYFMDNWLLMGIFGVGTVHVAALAAVAFVAYRRRARKRFFRTVLLPKAAQRGIAIADLVDAVQQFEVTDVVPDDCHIEEGTRVGWRSMVRAIPQLQQVLEEREEHAERTAVGGWLENG